ncbi:MAG: hypothetical protein MZW92_49585 [Comamonadaceae bacterium]|nr:hypothetical protein [Comamonadaceae bacterium]
MRLAEPIDRTRRATGAPPAGTSGFLLRDPLQATIANARLTSLTGKAAMVIELTRIIARDRLPASDAQLQARTAQTGRPASDQRTLQHRDALIHVHDSTLYLTLIAAPLPRQAVCPARVSARGRDRQ